VVYDVTTSVVRKVVGAAVGAGAELFPHAAAEPTRAAAAKIADFILICICLLIPWVESKAGGGIKRLINLKDRGETQEQCLTSDCGLVKDEGER